MEASGIPTESFESGAEMEKREIIWKIKNFPVIVRRDSMIDSQIMYFHAGETIGLASEWSLLLRGGTLENKSWIGIFVGISKRPAMKSEFLFTRCIFEIRSESGVMLRKVETDFTDMYGMGPHFAGGVHEFIDKKLEAAPFGETLIIHVNFRLFSPALPTQSLEDRLSLFMMKSRGKVKKEAGHVKGICKDWTYVRLVSCDGQEIKVQKEALLSRSPVLNTLIKTNRIEAEYGTITLPEIGTKKTMNVLVNFICTGKLIPEWKDPDVVVDLTKAAAIYQFPDLLEFLDSVLGMVCTLENVGALMELSGQYSMARAENDLLRFVRMDGTRSAENFKDILRSRYEKSSLGKAEEPMYHDMQAREEASRVGNYSSSSAGFGWNPRKRRLEMLDKDFKGD